MTEAYYRSKRLEGLRFDETFTHIPRSATVLLLATTSLQWMPGAAGKLLSPVAVNRHTQAGSAQQLFTQRQSRSQAQRQIEAAAAASHLAMSVSPIVGAEAGWRGGGW